MLVVALQYHKYKHTQTHRQIEPDRNTDKYTDRPKKHRKQIRRWMDTGQTGRQTNGHKSNNTQTHINVSQQASTSLDN